MKTLLLISLLLFAQLGFANNAELQFSSSNKQATLIELFTSQGCHSCPPADRWLGGLKETPELWKDYVPIAWHVDYWDHIGWKDRFAKPEHSYRQRSYKANGNVKSVYTPGLMQNGKEWRWWFVNRSLPKPSTDIGKLAVSISNGEAEINFKPTGDVESKVFRFNIALLNTGLEHSIKTGENGGKTLKHDFVVLEHQSAVRKGTSVKIPFAYKGIKSVQSSEKQAVAVWVEDPKSKLVLQATGSWL